MPSSTARPSRATKAKPAASVNAGALVTKARVFTPDAKLVAEFRDEAKSMMARLPPLRPESKLDRRTAEVHVLTTVERRTSGGLQESLQFCSAVDAQGNEESWIERTEGERRLFPRVLQVKKRLRGDDEYAVAGAAAGEAVEGGDDVDERQQATPRKVSKKAAAGTASSPSSSSRKAPSTSKKHRRAPPAHADEHENDHDHDDGTVTETDAEALRRARHEKRRSSARLSEARRGESLASSVKPEHDVDDLASLCGRVGGLEFRATVEPDVEPMQPVASSSRSRH
ncbi:hypothetical protein JCM8208_003998 [Rhodotorula glutinis]